MLGSPLSLIKKIHSFSRDPPLSRHPPFAFWPNPEYKQRKLRASREARPPQSRIRRKDAGRKGTVDEDRTLLEDLDRSSHLRPVEIQIALALEFPVVNYVGEDVDTS